MNSFEFEMTYSRTVRPADYESISIKYTQIFDSRIFTPRQALDSLRKFVLTHIEDEVMQMEAMKHANKKY